jgi:hypothetical protein
MVVVVMMMITTSSAIIAKSVIVHLKRNTCTFMTISNFTCLPTVLEYLLPSSCEVQEILGPPPPPPPPKI